MSKIIGLENISMDELQYELSNGAKFVVFEYCISILIMTFKQPSSIYFIRANSGAVKKGLGFTFISLFAGWWGFPWGPIYTIASLFTNLTGGKDVTREVMASLR